MTLNRTAGDRARASHPHDPLRSSRLHLRRGEGAQARVAEISGHDRTHFCGAYWGWGFHEDGVSSALRVAVRFGGSAVSDSVSCIYEGAVRHRRFDERRPRVPLPRRARLYRPRRAALALLERPSDGPRARSGAVPSPRLPRRCRGRPLAGAVGRGGASALGARAAGPDPAAHELRSLGHCFNPVSFYYCFAPSADLDACPRRGHEHAVGRAARVR